MLPQLFRCLTRYTAVTAARLISARRLVHSLRLFAAHSISTTTATVVPMQFELPRRNSTMLGDITQTVNSVAAPNLCRQLPLMSQTTTPVESAVSSRSGTPSAVTVSSEAVDPRYIPEYCEEIVHHLLMRERMYPRDGAYLEVQSEVTERMRQILIDWLIDVNLKFKLHPETFYLAVDIIDRFLSKRQVTRAQLQLVGITGVLIAAKHEEIWAPEVKDCVYISANTYTHNEVLVMEREIAAALKFRFTVATPYPVMCRLLDATDAADFVRWATMMYLDSAAHDYKLLQCLPSRVACAAVLLGRMTISLNSIVAPADGGALPSPASFWDATLENASHGVTFGEIEPIVMQLLASTQALTAPGSRLQAVRRKYLSQRFGAIAGMRLPTL